MCLLNCELNGRKVHSAGCSVGFSCCFCETHAVAMFLWTQTKLQKYVPNSKQGHFFVGLKEKAFKDIYFFATSNLRKDGPQPISEPSSLGTSSLADLSGIYADSCPLQKEERSYSQWKILSVNQSG